MQAGSEMNGVGYSRYSISASSSSAAAIGGAADAGGQVGYKKQKGSAFATSCNRSSCPTAKTSVQQPAISQKKHAFQRKLSLACQSSIASCETESESALASQNLDGRGAGRGAGGQGGGWSQDSHVMERYAFQRSAFSVVPKRQLKPFSANIQVIEGGKSSSCSIGKSNDDMDDESGDAKRFSEKEHESDNSENSELQ